MRLFANYRDTFKPAAFDFSLAENEGMLEPETSRSYEGGVKVRALDGRLDVEASAFHMDFENLVTSTVVNGLPALMNAGTTRFQGFELAMDLRLARRDVRPGELQRPRRQVRGLRSGVRRRADPARRQARRDVGEAAVVGRRVGVARRKASSRNASVNYTGDRFLNMRNTALVPGFSTVDLGVGYRTGRLEFRVDGRNLGNARDAVSESEFGDAQYYRMPAQSVRAGVVVKY